ncbi:type 4 pilus major pilin [Undibacterium arcticum]|uniref:Type 4 pilus major pilin n=1 Tax=Undibacterium arcticum TaxID=1762892 RepID=A0ABV7FBY1_9BURK
MSTNFQRRKSSVNQQYGFLSIEVIIVLIVVLTLLALGASKMDILTGNSDTTEELSNVQTLFANTKGLKSTSGYGASGTDLVPTLVSNQSIPKNMSVVTGVPYNLYGGTVQVVSNGPNYTITQNSVTASGCIKLATKVSRGGTFATTKINANTAIVGEVTAAVAGTQCSAATNTIAWTTTS